MKKSLKFYVLIWFVLLAAFNAIVFIVPSVIPGYVKYDSRFWIGWALIIIAFIGNLICALVAFKADNLQKLFYNLPLITISWSALIISLVVGSLLIIIPGYAVWIAPVVCILVLAFNAIAVIKASWAAEVVTGIDEKIKNQTSFIRNMTVTAESIMARTKDDEIKAECKKVYEAIRYSDPMSNEELSVIEAKITVKMDEMNTFADANDIGNIKNTTSEIINLIGERNRKCQMMK